MHDTTTFEMLFHFVGGLGMFLLGMKSMSEGVQAVFGAGLRRMIGAVTNNRLMATGVGAAVTCLVQSSSVTTVLVIGLVDSGFMNLAQAIGVIMGANIGTTITGWILVLKVGKYGLPTLGVAAFGYLFSKNEKLRFTAMAIMGVGMVFFGLELMKDAFAPIREIPEFNDWFQRFRADSYLGVLKCASVGCILTLIVQSSSATLGITIGLATTGVIEFEAAAALVLGENIGTTITAYLASLGAGANAKRAAYAHILFNVIGVAWITTIFRPYLSVVQSVLDLDPTVTRTVGGTETYPQVAEAIAAVHTGFNVANTLVFLPFVRWLAVGLTRVVADDRYAPTPRLTSLNIRMLESPVIAIEQSHQEIVRMGADASGMMRDLDVVARSATLDDDVVRGIYAKEERLDAMEHEITAFMTDLLSSSAPHSVIEEGRRQLRIADEYESISDYILSILKARLKLRHADQRLDEPERESLEKLHEAVDGYLNVVYREVETRPPELSSKAQNLGKEINLIAKAMRRQHLVRMSQERIDPKISMSYTAMLGSYRKIKDHVQNIAESLAGER